MITPYSSGDTFCSGCVLGDVNLVFFEVLFKKEQMLQLRY